MQRWLRLNVPSMFMRRLLLLLAAVILLMGALAGRMVNLAVVHAEDRRRQAEAALVEVSLTPTRRGRILDFKGRVLADDLPSYDVSVQYAVITGQWAYRRAYRKARVTLNRQDPGRWGELSYEERAEIVAKEQVAFDLQVESMWQTLAEAGHLERDEVERRKETINKRVQQIAAHVWASQRERLAEMNGDSGALAPITEIEEQRSPHEVLHGVDTPGRLRIQRLISDAKAKAMERDINGMRVPNDLEVWTQVSVASSRQRDYPLESMVVSLDRSSLPTPIRNDKPLDMELEGVGIHVIGAMRGIWAEDVNDQRDASGQLISAGRPFRRHLPDGTDMVDLGGYLPGDVTGAWGIERAQERRLRGERGRLIERLDGGTGTQEPPLPGMDVRLSVDVSLQARVQGIMTPNFGLMRAQPWHVKDPEADPLRPQLDQPLTGAAIVLDIATGQVRAAVSSPGFSRRQLREDADSLVNDQINRPLINRVIGLPLQPGSTVKPLILCAAITEREFRVDEQIECRGHLNPNDKTNFRCWIYKQTQGQKTHGYLGAADAIGQSCNIFFFTMGRRLGLETEGQWYRRFGLGSKTGSGLMEESPGTLIDPAWGRRLNATDQQATATQMGIGQGPVEWTLLQAAGAYAAIVRGGYYLSPTFVADPTDAHRRSQDMGADPHGIELAMRGMNESVNGRYGTGHFLHLPDGTRETVFNLSGVKVVGKSGTADPPPTRIDSDGDGKITGRDMLVREGDHAWFIAVVHRTDSLAGQGLVVAVVAEHAGSGGAVSGPIVNQILHALRAEGYL